MPEAANTSKSEYYEPYVRFSGLLRTWLVAYGIGVIAFITSQERISNALNLHDEVANQIILFLIVGIATQVIAALLYKYSMGYLYHGESDARIKKSCRYKAADKLSEWLWLEFVFDLASMGAYLYATYKLSALVSGAI